MRKISYPTGKKLYDFESKYLAALSTIDKSAINNILKLVHTDLTFDRLVLLPLAELISLEKSLTTISNTYKVEIPSGNPKKKPKTTNKFLDLFDYEGKQKQLSKVFRQEHTLNLTTCHYCGIDYINGFSDFGDYKGPLDFLNTADYDDLIFFPEIGKATALDIIHYRKSQKIKNIQDVKPNVTLRENLEKFNFKNNYDHFTLDHVIPQKPYGFFSLCLYNLVPSCYCCNTKFKSTKNFKINKSLLKISPTSKKYAIPDNFKFTVLYSGNLKDITKTTDFVLRLESSDNFQEVYKYDKTFKLTGRYIAHKSELLKLIKKKVKNPSCDIALKSKLLKISSEEYKALIYGKEILKKQSSAPMHKFKRDVAKNIKII